MRLLSCAAGALIIISSCVKHKGVSDDGTFPSDVARILLTRCAVAGCHNEISKDAAAGLSLQSWPGLFRGGNNGPAVIPFRPDYSTVCFYTNSFTGSGPTLEPRMPLGQEPLSHEEYLLLRNWIRNGAPDRGGKVAFNDLMSSRIYVANQLCDVVTVIDADSKLPMRYVDVGNNVKTEFPVCLRVAPDRRHWFVTFLATTVLQRFKSGNEIAEGEVNLGPGVWTDFVISSDSRYAYCADRSSPGKIARVDLEEMRVLNYYSSPKLEYLRGIVLSEPLNKLYVGSESGNFIHVVNISNPEVAEIKRLVLDETGIENESAGLDPLTLYRIRSSERCVVGCRGINKIILLDMAKDSILRQTDLNASPTSIEYTEKFGMLFVSCMDDTLSFSDNKGSVKVLNPVNGLVMETLNTGYQPSGLCVSSSGNYLAVINSNISAGGHRPHHVTGCGGRSGYVTFVDLYSLQLLPQKYELASYPFAAAIRE
jgi:DNA-binding beta-propeller fold protein YncE